MKKNLIYDIHESPKTTHELLLYATQQILAVFVATVLIANICGTPISSCLFGACIATLTYQFITGFKSPMFISSCGATCSAVIGALAISKIQNYLLVAIGGLIIFVIYAIFALMIKLKGINSINKVFPPIIIGPITMVIGLNLAGFIPTYVQVNGETNNTGVLIAIFTMMVIAITSCHSKGFLKTIPFLIGLASGYIVCILLTLFTSTKLIDFSVFKNLSLFSIPDFTFKYWSLDTLTFGNIVQVIILFAPVAVAAICEHYSDHKVLSNIIDTDLTVKPGLDKTLLGDGAGSLIGTILCGLPNTSYGESIATTGFSRVASTKVITVAALILGGLSFIEPVQIILNSIPSCVFGGCAMILYGYIAASGLKTLYSANVDLNKSKNLIIVSVILTVGISGIWLFNQAFAGVSLALILGVLLNLMLKENK